MTTTVSSLFKLGLDSLRFVGVGNIWVEDSIVDQDSLRFARSLIADALGRTTPGQLEILAFDDALSGITAPFQEVNGGGEKILHHISDTTELSELITHLRTHIQGVSNVIQGRADSLLDFRRMVGAPIEGFKLVVLCTDYDLLPDEIKNQLSALLKAGPRAGVTFLIHSMTLGVNEYVLGLCQQCSVDGTTVRDQDGRTLGDYPPREAEELIAASRRVAQDLATAQVDPVAFETVQDLGRPWSDSSRDGITFAVGTYGLSTIEVTLGDELNQRHNALITGAVGQGKSNLISVVIHSLCQRYSPAELELYLLDLKEGVTLQPFAPDQEGAFLPHARVLGLDADRHYAVNVLHHLYALYRERMARFKAAGVQSIRHYRLANPQQEMPRIVVVIDEFQLLFADDDDLARTAADLLVKGARLFRACGIHFVLASQTIGGNLALVGASEGLFAQVPVRLALKNSVAESHATLGIKNDAASHLRSRQAIVNLDYGEVSANRKTTIAYADEAVLAPVRRQWWQQATATTGPPEVFEGERRLALSDDTHCLSDLRPGQAMLGRRLSVGTTPLTADFTPDLGRNLALLGTGPGHAVLLSTVLGLAYHQPEARFLVLDLAGTWHSTDLVPAFEHQMSTLGAGYQLVGKHQADDLIAQLTAGLEPEGLGQQPPTYLIGLGMERWRTSPQQLQDLFKHGPLAGTHVLAWWRKHAAFEEVIGYGGQSNFDIRAAMHLDGPSAIDLFNDPLLHWTPQSNRMLVWDAAEMNNPQPVIPYSLITAP